MLHIFNQTGVKLPKFVDGLEKKQNIEKIISRLTVEVKTILLKLFLSSRQDLRAGKSTLV